MVCLIICLVLLLISQTTGFNMNTLSKGFGSPAKRSLNNQYLSRKIFLYSISSSESSSRLPVESKQIDLSEVSAEINICNPIRSDDNPFASATNIFQNKAPSRKENNNQPLIFIHGSFHAAWCWAEHYMPYFASLGYPCYALSLRGTGGTFAGEGVKKVKISEHVGDLTDFITYVRNSEGRNTKPVLIAHSFGGLAIMKYLEKELLNVNASKSGPNELAVNGVVSMCSVPPSGNGKMTMRFLKRSLVDSWKITAGLAMKKCITNKVLCRELFFDANDGGISDEDLERFQEYFLRDTVATIDLTDLAKQLPSANVDSSGKASFLNGLLPSLVIGANDDFIVDDLGVDETGRFFGVDPVIVDSSHDIMLGTKWVNGAHAIESWLEACKKQ